MTTIRNLFDSSKDIYRTIEKVITYAASQENRLKAEISEYWVTQSIEEQFRRLLDRMQVAMEAGGQNEIGVWVSGFYGSGKSSFTKYLGFAFDGSVSIDAVPFLKHLQDRLHTPQVKAQLATVARRFPAAVVMLDLASEMLAGATMEDVSTVLYYKVLQWAGYSRNLKVAALERRIEKDGRSAEFQSKVEVALPGVTWRELQNDPLVVDGLVPQIAHDMYPGLFPTPESFTASTEGFIQFEDQRVQEMLDIVRSKSGKQHVLFIVDEVGQYIATRDNLILNLDGLAKNLKRLGDGKVWIMATAQQTLTEDDPRAALNSDKLYKLNDRFPIKVDLESSDIKEICYRRLLGKSPSGEEELGRLFDTHGQALRHNTKLQDAKYYDADFGRESFVNLYPFLPAHFDILLHLLGALAKSTGGIGLRSAIKVIQDILVDSDGGRSAVADKYVGWLATTVTLYDALDKDIRRAFPSIHHAVNNTCIRFHGSQIHEEVAKSIAVLQILGNLPVTVPNLASLMHPSVDHASQLDDVRRVVEEMLHDPLAPLGDKDGNLGFLSEKLRDIEQERGAIPLRSLEVRRISNDAMREGFDPLPRASLHGTLTITSGLKIQSDSRITSLAGEHNPIQTVVEVVSATEYDVARIRLLESSSNRSGQHTIYMLSRTDPEVDGLAGEIYRCQRIAELHRNEPDQEVKDYCSSQLDRAATLAKSLQQKFKMALSHGSFIFRGQATAVAALDADVLESSRKFLSTVVAQVFDRYAEAPVRVETALAEKFLRVGNPAAITSALDPLGLVENQGGALKIKTDAKSIRSIHDFIDRNGTLEGKHLLDHFSEAPFGWSPDTVRYILSAMLMAGDIKLKVSGREVTTAGPQAIEALKTNKSFGSIGLSLREERPPIEMLARAAERLTKLTGERVFPLEQEISKAAVKQFPHFQRDYGPLAEKLSALSLPGVDRVRLLSQDITAVLLTDASDAPQRLGGEESSLYTNLLWAGDVKRALDNGLDGTIRDIQQHRRDIVALPDSGIPGDLRQELSEDLALLSQRLQKDDFYQHSVDLNSLLTSITTHVRDAVVKLGEQQKTRLGEGIEDLQSLAEWQELTQEERGNAIAQLEGLEISVSQNLAGLKQLLSQDYNINQAVTRLRDAVVKNGKVRVAQRIEEERAEYVAKGITKLSRKVAAPTVLRSADDIATLIQQLQAVQVELALYSEIEISLTLTE